VHAACRRLYAQERLDLNGMILAEYVPAFRWPSVLDSVIFRFLGDVLGYPNGDAGDIACAKSGAIAAEVLGTKRAKDIFPDWPEVDAALPLLVLDAIIARLKAGKSRFPRKRLRAALANEAPKRIAVITPEVERQLDAMSEYGMELMRQFRVRVQILRGYAQHAHEQALKRGERHSGRNDARRRARQSAIEDFSAFRDHFYSRYMERERFPA
jgi:hypothetical protein